MNKSVVVKICIVLSYILILVNLTTANQGLRDSASCRYLGRTDPNGKRCRSDNVKFHKLPNECSAFIYDGIRCTPNFEITTRSKDPDKDLDIIDSLIKLKNGEHGDIGHDVYVFYDHSSFKDYFRAICENSETEAQALKTFLFKYPVKGLIMDDIVFAYSNRCPEFHKTFSNYVRTIKSVNKNLEIGFYMRAKDLVTNTNKWFDFEIINDIVDFYLIEFITYNQCESKLNSGGITPIDSPDKNILTLKMFADAFMNCTINKEKVYFELLISPIVDPNFKKEILPCETSYNEYCENREEYRSGWCVENQDVLYEKGQFAKQYSKGFVGNTIDLVDRDNKCKCGNKYITFTMILTGYYGKNDKVTCDAFQ